MLLGTELGAALSVGAELGALEGTNVGDWLSVGISDGSPLG
jgi:hypothetical protein